LKGAKIIESENDLKWSAIKFLYDNAKNKHKSFLSNFENVKFEKMILLFYLFFGVKLCLQFQFSTILFKMVFFSAYMSRKLKLLGVAMGVKGGLSFYVGAKGG
jgi:hypothetical protein